MALGGIMPALQLAWGIPYFLMMASQMGEIMKITEQWKKETRPELYFRRGWAKGDPNILTGPGAGVGEILGFYGLSDR